MSFIRRIVNYLSIKGGTRGSDRIALKTSCCERFSHVVLASYRLVVMHGKIRTQGQVDLCALITRIDAPWVCHKAFTMVLLGGDGVSLGPGLRTWQLRGSWTHLCPCGIISPLRQSKYAKWNPFQGLFDPSARGGSNFESGCCCKVRVCVFCCCCLAYEYTAKGGLALRIS